MAVSDTNRSQSGAVAARTILAAFIIFALVVLLLPSGPFGDHRASAQASPSPTPTGPRIQFLNPSGTASSGPGKEVSAKNDTINTTYHLVAWVSQQPSSPSVEFKYQKGTDPEITIGTGTLRGTNTYDIEWNIAGLADATDYTVKAILYGGAVEVARDTETVEINNTDPTPSSPGNLVTTEHQGQTIEMTYPQAGGTFGLFRKPGTSDPHAGVIDAGFSTAAPGTTNIRAYYSTSAPGTEPQWTSCNGSGESAANAADGIRCTLASGANPSSVTAISVATDDAATTSCQPGSTCGTTTDSGDAHSTTGYSQTPTSITIAPATQRKNDADTATAGNQFPCSDVITATVLDQVSRKVVGANVDVHAAGPTDNIFYDDTSGASSGPSKAPDKAHGGLESTVDCETTSTPKPFSTDSQQGEHEVVGEGDIKHIETVAAGTTDAGQFKFQLYNQSTTLTGTTRFTAFYDRDDDDLFCSGEPAGHGSIGWEADPAAPSGLASETGTCPEPTGTPTASTTASPTASTTASPTPTKSPSPGTASPTASPSPGTSRTVTLVASASEVEVRETVTLSGRILSSASQCTNDEFVQIRRRVHGSTLFEDFTSTQTASDGTFDVSFVAVKSADYQAFAPRHDNCADGSSDPVSVLVRVKITITVSDFSPERGDRVRFLGKVIPNHTGTKVILQRKKGDQWVKVRTDSLNQRSRYRIVIPADWRRSRFFRVQWTSQDDDHETSTSQTMEVRTHR